jgi:hypothetical protein
MNRIKNKNPMIISKSSEKASDKNSASFHDENPETSNKRIIPEHDKYYKTNL